MESAIRRQTGHFQSHSDLATVQTLFTLLRRTNQSV